MINKLVLFPLSVSISLSSIAETSSTDVLKANLEMRESFKKVAMLTDLLTDEGKKNFDLALYQGFNTLTKNVDDFVAEGLKRNFKCDVISTKLFDMFTESDSKAKVDMNDVQKRVIEDLTDKATDYADVQCKFLSGE